MKKDTKQKDILMSNYIFAGLEVSLALASGILTVWWLAEHGKNMDTPSVILAVFGGTTAVFSTLFASDGIKEIIKQKKINRQR